MRTREKKFLITALAIVPIVALLAVLLAGWALETLFDHAMGGHPESHIVATGPFASRFERRQGPGVGLYPNREEEIQAWFLDALPQGISRKDARAILSKSFSKDLTRRRAVVIHSLSSPAGSCSTSVRLIFDKDGGFESVEVEQHFASVMGSNKSR